MYFEQKLSYKFSRDRYERYGKSLIIIGRRVEFPRYTCVSKMRYCIRNDIPSKLPYNHRETRVRVSCFLTRIFFRNTRFRLFFSEYTRNTFPPPSNYWRYSSLSAIVHRHAISSNYAKRIWYISCALFPGCKDLFQNEPSSVECRSNFQRK